ARTELEGIRSLVEDLDARHIRREQVRRELDPPERAAERPGERLGEDRLAGAGNVLDEDVAATDQGDERELDLVVLAEDDPLDVLDDARDSRSEGLIHRAYVPLFVEFPRPISKVWVLYTAQRGRASSSYTVPRLPQFRVAAPAGGT